MRSRPNHSLRGQSCPAKAQPRRGEAGEAENGRRGAEDGGRKSAVSGQQSVATATSSDGEEGEGGAIMIMIRSMSMKGGGRKAATFAEACSYAKASAPQDGVPRSARPTSWMLD